MAHGKTQRELNPSIRAVPIGLLLCVALAGSSALTAKAQDRRDLHCETRTTADGRTYEFCRPDPQSSQAPTTKSVPPADFGQSVPVPTRPSPPSISTPRPPPSAGIPSDPSFDIGPLHRPPPAASVPSVPSGDTAPPPPPPAAAEGRPSAPPTAGQRQERIGSAPRPALQAVRALIEPSEIPPKEVAAYGIVAFTTAPVPSDRERYKLVCEAFKATLIPQEDLAPKTPLSEQMITFWPIRNKHTAEAVRAECNHLVENYHLKTGLDAINDADRSSEKLAEQRGPFLVAWSPAESRYKADALVLVMDLSRVDGEQRFLEIFRTWRQKIVDNPTLWKGGFADTETFRRTVRDLLDRYGDGILKLIKIGS